MRLQHLPDLGLPEGKAVLICQNTRTSLERMEMLVRAAIPGEARMSTVSWVSSLFSSSNPFQGPLWGCHRVSGKTGAQDHSSCHIWWNQSEKAPPLPIPLKTAHGSLGPLPHITSGGLGVPRSHPDTLRLLLGIQPQAQVWWAFLESPVPRPVLCLWKACLQPRTVIRLASAEGMAGGGPGSCINPPSPHASPLE